MSISMIFHLYYKFNKLYFYDNVLIAFLHYLIFRTAQIKLCFIYLHDKFFKIPKPIPLFQPVINTVF